MNNNNLTLVTALFDIGRGEMDSDFSRSYDQYLDNFKELLKLKLPLVVFCDNRTEEFINQHKTHDNVTILSRTVDDLQNFPFYDRVQEIRENSEWITRSGWIVNSPQAVLPLYNPLVMSKQFYLNDASIFNYYNTKYFAWIDAGLANTVNISSYFNDDMFIAKLLRKMNKLCYVAFPYDGTVEVHGFEKNALNKYAGTETEYVVRGGFFGGTRTSINRMNTAYYSILDETLRNGLMGTEESLFTILSYRHPEEVDLNFIDSNGLIYKFFENIKNSEYDVKIIGDGSIGIYVLTYNLPKQFKMWVESFKQAYPNEFQKFKKYVINNSTDDSVTDEYKELFESNGFIEFRYNNIGINDARYEAASHFDESDHEFMIFFEDDMLLHLDQSPKSKLGFCTHYSNVFDTCIDIIRREDIDYLKLSFDEFYGDNTENWGWYNLSQEKKEALFPNGDNRTKVHHIGSVNGLPYAIGEYHYCNWPIMFTKRGNRKIFIDNHIEHKYEQTWMAMTCINQRDGKIKAGSLLASIINHNRVYHYPKEHRKENKYQ